MSYRHARIASVSSLKLVHEAAVNASLRDWCLPRESPPPPLKSSKLGRIEALPVLPALDSLWSLESRFRIFFGDETRLCLLF